MAKNMVRAFKAIIIPMTALVARLPAYGKVSDKVDLLLYHHYVDKNEWKDGRGEESFGTAGDVGNTLIKVGYDISDVQRITLSYDKLKDEGRLCATS